MVWVFTTSCYQLNGKKSWFSLGPPRAAQNGSHSLKKLKSLAIPAAGIIFLDHRLATADINRLAGDALGLIRGEITNQFGDFIGL